MNTRAPDTLQPADTWRSRAACLGQPAVFFPDGDSDRYGTQIDTARAMCMTCPVIADCLDWALRTREEHGVWGGHREGERQALLKRHTWKLRDPHYRAQIVTAAIDKLDNAEPLPTLLAPPTLHKIYEQRTAPGTNGCTRWTRDLRTKVKFGGHVYTPMQLAFLVGNGRPADGKVGTICGTTGCVNPQHLADNQIRAERRARGLAGTVRNTPQELHTKWAVTGIDGHMQWTGPRQPSLNGRPRSPQQLAFRTAHGRPPVGQVKPTCGFRRCVTPDHMQDSRMRQELKKAAEAAVTVTDADVGAVDAELAA